MALYLKEVDGRSYREIAQILGCSEAAVSTLLFRARKAFAEHYGVLAESRTGRCAEAQLMFAVVLDGEGGAVERRALQAHLDECRICSAALVAAQEMRAARGLLPLLPAPHLSGPVLDGGATSSLASALLEAARALIARVAGAPRKANRGTGWRWH